MVLMIANRAYYLGIGEDAMMLPYKIVILSNYIVFSWLGSKCSIIQYQSAAGKLGTTILSFDILTTGLIWTCLKPV